MHLAHSLSNSVSAVSIAADYAWSSSSMKDAKMYYIQILHECIDYMLVLIEYTSLITVFITWTSLTNDDFFSIILTHFYNSTIVKSKNLGSIWQVNRLTLTLSASLKLNPLIR